MNKASLLGILFLAQIAKGQSIMTIQSGAQVFIGSHSTFVLDKLVLQPSTDIIFTGSNFVNKTGTIVHPASNSSINQAYNFLQTVTAYSGSITMYYSDADLNGLTESSLALNIYNGTSWTAYSPTAVNTSSNYVTTDGLSNLSLNELTLAAANAPLPVRFSNLNASCIIGGVLLRWSTTQESNNLRFEVERSADGSAWNLAGEVQAAGNTSTNHDYNFTDVQSSSTYYRIVSIDANGRKQFSSILRNACAAITAFAIYPNPVRDRLTVLLKTATAGPCTLLLYDNGGKLLQKNVQTAASGTNYFIISMDGLPAGAYQLRLQQNDDVKNIRLVKQ